MFNDPRLENVSVSEPFVTVVVTSYNYGRYILDCLESIAKQTYRNFKCVVVDDCSTDDSRRLVDEFAASKLAEGKFLLVCHDENLGQMGGFVTGLRHAEGPFVVYVDADDLLLEDFLAVHIDAHSSRFEPVAFTSSNQYQINENGELIGGTHPDLRAKGRCRYVTSRPIHEPFWVWATTSSMMFRRAVLESIFSGCNEGYRICADNYICHFANLLGGSLLLPTVLGCYRRHGGNNFSNNSMVGGCHPTGDMASHPKHCEVRLHIFHSLCSNGENFIKLLSHGRFVSLLACLIGPFEVFKYFSRLPDMVSKWELLVILSMLRLKGVLVRLKYIFRRDQNHFDFGENADILKLPGE